MKLTLLIFSASILILATGCSKNTTNQTMNQQKPVDKQMTGKTDKQTDDQSAELTKEADAAITKLASDKSEESKSDAVKKCMAAANYLMFDSNLPAKEKYRPALKYYRKVLELEPKNEEAQKNKKQIEDIYESMGMPIPQ